MCDFLALITNKVIWKLHSIIIKFILGIYGIKVGKKFYIEGTPKLKIRGKAGNITIGDNVSIYGDIDLRNRENGRIIIENNVNIENDCRFVSAREGSIIIKEGAKVGCGSVFTGGADIIIGKKCMLGPRITINANEHRLVKNEFIADQGYIHEPVIIEEDCLIGANTAINKGVKILRGSVIGANAVVTKDTESYSINAGVPAKKIGERS
ncbi:MAG: DapH/DapD/GlmU-related protein [Armatimonadota bacterium]